MATRGGDVGVRRQLAWGDGVALFVGIILGSGIFVAPAAVSAATASAWSATLPWLIGGLVAGCGALCYAECGARLPQSGGFFVFYREAHGEPLAFVAGWTAVLVTYPASLAAIAHVHADYLVRLLPADTPAVRALAATGAIVAAGMLNAVGVRAGAWAQRLLTGTKVAALLLLVVAAVLSNHEPPAATPAVTTPATFGVLLGAVVLVLWTYDGWSDVTLVAGELRDPARSLGRTVLVGTVSLTAVYCLVQLAVSVLLSPAGAARSDRVVAEAVEAGLGANAGLLVALLVVVSTFGAINGVVLTASRIGFAMARARVFPAWFGVVSARSATPVRAVLGLVAATLIYVVVLDFGGLLGLFSFAVWIFYALTAVALLRLRRRGVGEPLAWKAPGGILPPAVVLVTASVMTVSLVLDAPWRSLVGATLLATGFPVYFAWRNVARKRAGRRSGGS